MTERDALVDFPSECLSPPPAKRRVLLLGDSHANMFRPALDDLADSNVMEATYAACAPDEALGPDMAQTPCGRLIRKALAVAQRVKPDLIVVSWQVKRLRPERVLALGAQLKRIGAPILVIGPTPEYAVRVPKLLSAARIWDRPGLPAQSMSRFLWKSDDQLAPLARTFAVYLSPRAALCEGKMCTLMAGRDPAYYDRQHFNGAGARAIFRRMVTQQLTPEQRARLGLAFSPPLK